MRRPPRTPEPVASPPRRPYNSGHHSRGVPGVSAEQRIYVFPEASTATMIGAMGVVLGFFAFAVFIEIYRRRRDRRLRLEAEWRALRALAAERGVPPDDLRVLEEVVARHAPDHPYRAVTQRHAFDQVVEKEMNRPADPAAYRARGVQLRDIRVAIGMDFAPIGQRIHSTRELYLQQQLWVSTGAGDAEWHRLTVFAVDEAHFLAAPVNGDPLPAFQPGAALRFRMWREEDARYLFTATVDQVERAPAGIRVRHTAELNRRQSRSHYRLRHEDAVDIAILAAPKAGGDAVASADQPVVGTLRGRFSSLSGGGFSVVVGQPVPRQVLLRVTLALEGQDPFEATGRIVGDAPLMGGRHLVRAAFVGMDDDHRDRITHYIFQVQQRAVAAQPAAAAE